MGFISDNYGIEQTTPVMTDKYHFATAYGYWLEGRADNPSVFYMFGRKEALDGGYTIAAGLEGVIDIVERWQQYGFSEEDIRFLRAQTLPSGARQFPEAFIDYLKNAEFKLKIDAAPEGSVFFPQEPVLRVEGPIAQVKMLESVALGIINGHSGYATQAARQADVVGGVLENGSPSGAASVQGLRRGPGLGASLEASRSLGLGGYTTSSTGTAAKQFGQVFAGTMDHAWVMTHREEIGPITLKEMFKMRDEGRTEELQTALAGDAFRSFAFAHQETGILLVDTYDPIQGLENAITVIKEMRELGLGKGYGVRFDSGDIVKYSKIALRRFAEEGFIEGLDRSAIERMNDAELLKHADKCSVFCAAADGIDEHAAKEMRAAGSFFKSWGIGTGGSHIKPVGLVFKAASVYMDVLAQGEEANVSEMTPVMKVASNAPVKSSNPGKINSRRYYDSEGQLSHVVIYDENLGLHEEGKRVDLRDFGRVVEGNQAAIEVDLLVPVFDAQGCNVFVAPAQKKAFEGSGRMVTDLAKLAERVKEQLASLPEDVRRVERPRDEMLKQELLAAFKQAQQEGETELTLDVAALEAGLPAEVAHIPVFLDMNLFNQRMVCEQKHLAHANRQGVAEYQERFEARSPDFSPTAATAGEITVQGVSEKRQALG